MLREMATGFSVLDVPESAVVEVPCDFLFNPASSGGGGALRCLVSVRCCLLRAVLLGRKWAKAGAPVRSGPEHVVT